ncbi:hypothetical protein T439DRAFT_384057 [Meredithblackwellia eburnea MCA 4105]
MEELGEPIVSTQVINGHTADILTWPAPVTPPSRVICFITGNPGLPGYYTQFINQMRSKLPKDTTFYCIGHLGHSPTHSPRTFSSNGTPSLKDQVDAKIKFVDELQEKLGVGVEQGKPKLILIGHSIGSYCCLQTIKARPNAISSLHLLFSTISHIAASPNGVRLSPIFFHKALITPIALSGFGLSLVPARNYFLNPLVRLLSRQSGPPALVTAGLVSSPGTISAALSMAKEELDGIKALDKDLVREFKDRCWWYWSKDGDDHWVPKIAVDEICETLEEAGGDAKRRIVCEEGMKHAFVLNEAHTKSLAERCAGWVLQDFPDSASKA